MNANPKDFEIQDITTKSLPSEVEQRFEASEILRFLKIKVPPNYEVSVKYTIKEEKSSETTPIQISTQKTSLEDKEIKFDTSHFQKISGNISGQGEYTILTHKLFEQRTINNELRLQIEGLKGRIDTMETESIKREGKLMRKLKNDKLSMIPYAVFSLICVIVLTFSLSAHIFFRLTNVSLIKPEISYLLALASFGWLMTSLTGLYNRGKNGLG